MRATYEVWGDEYDDGFFPPRLRRAAGAGVTVVDDGGNQVHTFSVPSQEIALLTRDLLNHYFDEAQRTPHVYHTAEELLYSRCFECGHELALWVSTLQSVAFSYGIEAHRSVVDPSAARPRPESGEDVLFCPHCLHDF